MENLPVDNFDPKAAYSEIYANLKQPHLFAQTFCEAAETQKRIEDTLKKIIRSLMQTDSETKKSLMELIKIVERENLLFFGKKVSFAIWTGIIFIIGSISNAIIHHFIK